MVATRVVRIDGRQLEAGGPGGSHGLGLGGDREDGMGVSDGDRPVAVRHPVGRHPGRAVDRAHLGPGIGGGGGGVEGRILDVVAHGDDVLGPHRFHVHEGPAMVQPELSVVMVGDLVAEVHELGWCTHVDLETLEDGLDRIPSNPRACWVRRV